MQYIAWFCQKEMSGKDLFSD